MKFKLLIAYDGTDFLGWQSQPGGKTVQDVIEAALAKVFKKSIRLHGASRTDSGVHGWGQVAHFEADWPYPIVKLHRALQSLLPPTVQIRRIEKTKDSFHARFSAKGKRYLYKIKTAPSTPFEARTCWSLRYPTDLKLLKEALRFFEGKHNFASFAGGVNPEETLTKKLTKVSAVKKGQFITVTVIGSGFLYKMVRSIVGTAVEVARGKLDIKEIKRLLKTPRRTHAVITAPAQGLILDKVFY